MNFRFWRKSNRKSNKSIKRKALNILIKTTIIGLLLILVLVSAGVFYEEYARYRDSDRYAPPGEIIAVNDHKMHIYGEGDGDATVVFASGWGIPCPYAEYYPLYNEIAKHARVVVYDRPGYGWSEVANSPRDIDTITKEIHELMEKSGEKPPYILVGHSLASLEVLRFTQLYEEEVKGVVLLDGGNPQYYAKESFDGLKTSELSIGSILSKTGILRLLFNNSDQFVNTVYAPRNNFTFATDSLKELDKAMYLKHMINKNKSDEIENIKGNGVKVVEGGDIGEIPLIILTSESDASDPKWKSSQEALKKMSTNSKQRIIEGTKHNMHQYAPNAINEEILKILNN